MPIFGSDKAAKARPQPGNANGNWMSGGMAQLMVFLNGLILTITAFVTLNIFIDQIVQDSHVTEVSAVTDYIEKRLDLVGRDVQAASSILSFSEEVDSQQLALKIQENFNETAEYEQVYWLQRQTNGQFVAHKIMGAKASLGPEIHKQVVLAMSGREASGSLLTDAVLPITEELRGAPGLHPLVVAVRVKVYNREQVGDDFVYAVTSLQKILYDDFLINHRNIDRLSLVDKDGGNVIFSYQSNAPKKQNEPTSRKASLSVLDRNFEISVDSILDEREHLLKSVPMWMLAFGLTLTLIGTAYVRMNQKQALRLTTMNAELAKKNTDLNFEIVEREKLNQALRKEERENRAIIDSVSDIIFETGTDGQILFLNDTWHKITGFPVDVSLGRNLFDMVYQQDQPEQRNNFAMMVKGKKQSYRAFTRLRNADGSFRAVELAVSMLRHDEGSGSFRVVGTITDVEERRRAERALSEAEKKYRAIVENAASGIYQITPEGQYLSANPAMAKILGFNTSEEILREVKNGNNEVYLNGRERERHLSDVIRSGESVHAETQVRRRDGSVIWVHENLRAVKDDADQLIFFEGSLDDITTRKETELALREAKVASDLASRAKSEFLANMSHELRTPLNAIIGFSEIIHTQAFGAVGSEEYLAYAKDINDSGKRLLHVINDILDVSRVEAGERQLNEGIVDLHKIVSSTLDIMSSKIESSEMILSNHIDTNTPKLIGEAHAIKQMVSNLLSNALKYTPARGRISLSYELDDFGQLHLSITDTGIGLSSEEIEKALSPFGQVNAEMSKTESGTGLGLTLVQSLMSLHGGSFELVSQKGIGTTATLVFPPKRVSMPKKQTETV